MYSSVLLYTAGVNYCFWLAYILIIKKKKHYWHISIWSPDIKRPLEIEALYVWHETANEVCR